MALLCGWGGVQYRRPHGPDAQCRRLRVRPLPESSSLMNQLSMFANLESHIGERGGNHGGRWWVVGYARRA